MPVSSAIPRRKLSHEVADRLLALIEAGEWPAGSHLPSERELMARFSVGRPVIREALQSLEGMGLISITHGERARALPLTARKVLDRLRRPTRHLLATSPATHEHLKEARQWMEVGLVRIAAERATSDDVHRLEEKLAAQRAALPDRRRFIAADIAFHAAIAAISGNPLCEAASEAVLGWLFDFHVEMLGVPGAEEVTLAEHREILERIAAHDPDGAAQKIVAHLARVNERYRGE